MRDGYVIHHIFSQMKKNCILVNNCKDVNDVANIVTNDKFLMFIKTKNSIGVWRIKNNS